MAGRKPYLTDQERAERKEARRLKSNERMRERYKLAVETDPESVKAKAREYYKENKERILASQKKYYERNKERIQSYYRNRYYENREENLKRQNEYDANHRPEMRARVKAWKNKQGAEYHHARYLEWKEKHPTYWKEFRERKKKEKEAMNGEIKGIGEIEN